MNSAVLSKVSQNCGREILHARPFAYGNRTHLALLDMEDGTRLIAKVMEDENAEVSGKFDLEGDMLRYLAEHSDLPVPGVVYVDEDVLVVTYVPGTAVMGQQTEEHAADLLAKLHSVTADSFGFDHDTVIGGLHQPNKRSEDWVEFFRDHRLLYPAREAVRSGKLAPEFLPRIEALAERLSEWLSHSPTPSLIHGDVWGGNVLSVEGKISAFIDPAIYFADPEMELAFIGLFHTFGDTFFARYQQHRPIDPAFWEVRRHLYNLYPLLVHVQIYGNSYSRHIAKILDRFGV